jgi:hypothetical protein
MHPPYRDAKRAAGVFFHQELTSQVFFHRNIAPNEHFEINEKNDEK